MADSFEVVQSSPEDGLTEEQRHEVVAAQLRGEAKAEGQGPDAVVAAVASELKEIGLEPDPSELHRRYEEIDPDIPELADADSGADAGADADRDARDASDRPGADELPADAGTGAAMVTDPSRTDGPVSAGVDGARDHAPVDDPAPVGDPAPHDDPVAGNDQAPR
jgi:hypothetical protein